MDKDAADKLGSGIAWCGFWVGLGLMSGLNGEAFSWLIGKVPS